MLDASSAKEVTGKEDAIVVLGCRVVDGRPSTALEYRLRRAAELNAAHPHLPVIMSGGTHWSTATEAEVMAAWWQRAAHDSSVVVREERSHTTRQNAFFVAQLCAKKGYRRIVLVTCDYHMTRAKGLFSRQGLSVTTAPANAPLQKTKRVRLLIREWGARFLERLQPWVG